MSALASSTGGLPMGVGAPTTGGVPIKRKLEESDSGSPPALTIHLWAHGFSVGANSALYPYDASTRSIMLSIDRRRLCPELLDLLEDQATAVFQNGSVMLELHDHRAPPTSGMSTGMNNAAAQVRRVHLEGDSESLVADAEAVCAAHPEWTERELLAFEAKVLNVARRDSLCLDPSPDVARAAQLLAYNTNKFHFRPRRSLVARSRAGQGRAGAAFVVPLSAQPLLKFLLSYRNPPPYVFGGLSLGAPNGASNSTASSANGNANGGTGEASETALGVISTRLQGAPNRYAQPPPRVMRFQRSANRAVIVSEVAARAHGHELSVRCGTVMMAAMPQGHAQADASTEPVRVVLGGAYEAAAFVRRLPSAAERDGYMLTYDSADPHVQPPSNSTPLSSAAAAAVAAQSGSHAPQAGLGAHYSTGATSAMPTYAGSAPKMGAMPVSTAAQQQQARAAQTRKAAPKHKPGAVGVASPDYAQLMAAQQQQQRANAAAASTPLPMQVQASGGVPTSVNPNLNPNPTPTPNNPTNGAMVRTVSAPAGSTAMPGTATTLTSATAGVATTQSPIIGGAMVVPSPVGQQPVSLSASGGVPTVGTAVPAPVSVTAASAMPRGRATQYAPPPAYAKPAAHATHLQHAMTHAHSLAPVPTGVPAPTPTPTLLSSGASVVAGTTGTTPTYTGAPLYATPVAAPPYVYL